MIICSLTSFLHIISILVYDRITGLPTSTVDAFQNLVELHLNNNGLQSIPAEICTMKKAKRLDFSNNEITDVPHEIGYVILAKYNKYPLLSFYM